METAVKWLVGKLMSPLWRRAEDDDVGFYMTDTEEIRRVPGGVVTRLCQDYGLIDDAVYFTAQEVMGGVPLRVGDGVTSIAVRGGPHGGWRALRVELLTDSWEEGGGTSLESEMSRLRPLTGTVTSCDRDGGFINQTTFFPRRALCDGYEPMKGDWVQAQYFISATEWSSQAHSVSPLRYRRMDNACVSSVLGRSGVVEDSVFFSLDSVLLPGQYRPCRGDRVNMVVLESSQSFYCWRALCMAPTQPSVSEARPGLDGEMEALQENRGGLLVSQDTHFSMLMLGECRELVVWIENHGSEVQTLKRCELAGWDSEGQFSLRPLARLAPPDALPKAGPWRQTPGPATITQILWEGVTRSPQCRGPYGGLTGLSAPTPEGPDGAGDGGGAAWPPGKDPVRAEDRNADIAPGAKLSVTVSCRAKTLGRCTEMLLLHFPLFTIGRRLELSASSAEERLLLPSAPYSPSAAPPRPPPSQQVVTVLPTAPPTRLLRRHLPSFLGSYPVPQALWDCVEQQSDVLVAQPKLAEPLSPATAHGRFSALLWLEEVQAARELREFSLSGALLRKGAHYLHLEVPGLAEGRPSVFIGDRVTLKKPLSGGLMMEYISYVMEINDEDLSLRVNADLQHSYLGEPLDVEFTFNRLTMRRCHCALEQTRHFGENVLFPSKVTLQDPVWNGEWLSGDQEEDQVPEEEEEEEGRSSLTTRGPNILSMCVDMVSVATQTNPDVAVPQRPIPKPGQFFLPALNPAQREAVRRILAGEARPTPYVLFGPPGTGKTITLIETILQVYHRVPSSRLLVCTPSNSAADLICLRLHHSGFLRDASLVRVNATCRQEESVQEVLRQYCRAGEDLRHASFHRIVVSTCSSAGMFYQIGLRVGHFTHVFIDEAGQATEPEAMIPLGLLSERDGQMVLAGDPQQLGPVVKSRLASAFGLGVSLIERLMATALYSAGESGYNPLLVTKLVWNYRSHEALLALPSRLFYRGELCARAPRRVVEALCHWRRLPARGFPLLFHGLRGTEMREASNPSWFNPGEAVQVMLYCCQLAKRLYRPIAASQIGVIAPYRKQVEKIRVLLSRVGLTEIKVGSVEEFQGQEFLVIILSTVRSNDVAVTEDVQYILGFLSNPKRFNVAITRPKALLIIVGNPHVLIKDPCFSALLQYCFENGAIVGCDPPSSLHAAPPASGPKHPHGNALTADDRSEGVKCPVGPNPKNAPFS
ncbi:RNA helicase Mov10l1 isoform X2 [Conger conger]|uniref:RNA helicase Mov10l1 isoform X2 n=1 Tax=Conger conger TaxID=82655 RepID=UPI002A59B5F5|nr:RNA helicase Mov10l1 isoform X2 [Conger conger]XP_061085698.1 RNA helicase Mov10l1 isoform X2 [Conger conger]